MTAMALVGAALGAVLFATLLRIAPPRRSALVELGQFYSHYRGPDLATSPSGSATSAQSRIGVWASAELAKRGIRYSGLRHDLELTGQTLDTVMGRKVVAAVGGFLTGLAMLSLLQYLAGLTMPTGAPLAVAVLAAAVLFIAPDVDVRKEAKKRRAEFTEQLSIFLDLVSLKMAGHAAPAAALPEAAQRGGGWPMMLIRDTLFRARLSGQDEWDALGQLGERIAVRDLSDLGALIKLVSDDGAQIRATLTARAASMRRARLADEEGNAEERNQSMRLAHMLIAVGFMVFVGYPAFVNINL
ncbi:MAG: hypothetical protein JWM76_757 [Pseudonocardiales bacterium]|nr:hypothetical protein [Pseudonocardiales bacterium]